MMAIITITLGFFANSDTRVLGYTENSAMLIEKLSSVDTT
jgi:hypothetical protein